MINKTQPTNLDGDLPAELNKTPAHNAHGAHEAAADKFQAADVNLPESNQITMNNTPLAERTSAGITNIETPNLQDVLEPFVAFLQSTYTTANDQEFMISFVDHFGRCNPDDEEVEIELPDNLLDHQPATRAIATLLHATGTERAWSSDVPADHEELHSPLRFRLEKRGAWAGHFWKWCRHVVVDSLEEFDVEAAREQVSGLIEYLSDPANLLQLDQEVLALF